jgi:ribosomal protein L11 methyltransferase
MSSGRDVFWAGWETTGNARKARLATPLTVLELRLSCLPGPSRDRLADRLWEELGAAWVSTDQHELVAGFAEDALAQRAADATGGRLAAVDEHDLSYLDAWREWARPAQAGRLLIRPPWVAASTVGPGPEIVEVVIDPGHAFGHGGHPSTRLVLEALSARLRPGQSVLDVGCGSGVLSVAAAALGAGSVTAIDIDPVAVSVTSANAQLNGVADRITASDRPVAAVPGRFDVVLANIGVVVLRELTPFLVERLKPGGWLALSGLLEHQWEEVAPQVKGRIEGVLREEGWTAVVIERPSSL